MKKFSNIETTLISKWYGDQIDIILDEAKTDERIELIAILSEEIENIIMDDLQVITEGYVSEIIHNSFEDINYHELIDYYKD